MNYKALENNIIETVQEFQAKLGYMRAPIRFFYPLASLNNLLETELDAEGMVAALEGFNETTADSIGKVSFQFKESENRFNVKVPATGVEYIHEVIGENEFLKALMELLRKPPVQTEDGIHPGCSIEEIIQVFHQFSDDVIVEHMEDDAEFDTLIYFADGKPDGYRYCMHDEGVNYIYHRFTPFDLALRTE